VRSIATFIALNRFGMGAGPGDDARVGDDPRGWLQAQIRPGAPLPEALRGFRSSDEIATEILAARHEGVQAMREVLRKAVRSDLRAESLARGAVAASGEAGLAERLVLFWSNHFTVSSRRGRQLSVTIPAYEREAIRPHVFGRFADMLRAVARHPTMLTYLDNTGSVGPDSPVGQRRRERRGVATTLNENFAREVLELHTLGVNGGYAQEDVINLAQALTGWNHGGRSDPAHGRFAFLDRQHQPGPKTVLGRTYAEAGVDEGLAILDDLARHPATAQHLATKLARHFIADHPPAAAIDRLARVFLDSDGDLAQVTAALINLDAAWADPLAKVKSHYDFVIAVHRAAGLDAPTRRSLLDPLALLGMTPFAAPSPQGWGDLAGNWLGPEALMIRLEWARQFAGGLPRTLVPRVVLEDSIGAVAQAVTATWVERAPSGDAGLAMIFASPEFQRR